VLATVPPLAALLGVTSAMFAVEGALLNAAFLRLAWRFHAAPSDERARDLFRASLWYLPLLLILMVFHSRHWHAAPAPAGPPAPPMSATRATSPSLRSAPSRACEPPDAQPACTSSSSAGSGRRPQPPPRATWGSRPAASSSSARECSTGRCAM